MVVTVPLNTAGEGLICLHTLPSHHLSRLRGIKDDIYNEGTHLVVR